MLVIYFAIPIFAALLVAIVKIHLDTNREIKEFKKWTEQN
jgi:hypothetical protein